MLSLSRWSWRSHWVCYSPVVCHTQSRGTCSLGLGRLHCVCSSLICSAQLHSACFLSCCSRSSCCVCSSLAVRVALSRTARALCLWHSHCARSLVARGPHAVRVLLFIARGPHAVRVLLLIARGTHAAHALSRCSWGMCCTCSLSHVLSIGHG